MRHCRPLIIDPWFDQLSGVWSPWVRLKHGRIKKGRQGAVQVDWQIHQVDSVGVVQTQNTANSRSQAGEVGFIIAGIKDIHGWHGRRFPDAVIPLMSILLPGFFKKVSAVLLALFPVVLEIRRFSLRRCQKSPERTAPCTMNLKGIRGAGLWSALRLPRHVAHGDHQERLEREYNFWI